MITTKLYDKIDIDEKKILRYAQCTKADETVIELMCECIDEAGPVVKPMLCYAEIGKEEIDALLDCCSDDSAFKKYMDDSDKAVIFAATIGLPFDRLIARCEKLSLAKAQMLNSVGVQQVEELCDMFCDEISRDYPNAKPRFSPGFGGLNLEAQNYLFSLLDCGRRLGLTLNSSLLMSPSKSVTAIIAIPENN